MLIHPSLLEYTLTELNQKLLILKNNKKLILKTVLNQKSFNLHLDFVGKDFAENRKIMKSLSLKAVFIELQKTFGKTKLNLTIHLMSEIEDYKSDFNFLKNYQLNKNWSYTFYVNKNYTKIYQELLHNTNVGIWLDFHEWQGYDFVSTNINDYLIMTVEAGLSGQKKLENIKNQIIKIATLNPKINFLLDGGWQLEEINTLNNLLNLNIVSYASFWNKLKLI